MQSNLQMHLAKRCHATSKRTGKPCQAPAVKGWAVCRMHGANGGRPTTCGLYTYEAKTIKKMINTMITEAKGLSEKI